MTQSRMTELTTGEVRISYEHLVRPYAANGGDAKYSATLLIPKSDIETKRKIDAAIAAAKDEGILKKWAGSAPTNPPHPVYDGDGYRPSGEPFGAECRGHWVLTASSMQRQDVVDMQLMQIFDETQIYSGMYAQVHLNFFPYASNGRKGIGAGLGPVRKTRDGESLGGRRSAEDVFGTAQAAPAAPAYPQQAPAYPQQAPAVPAYAQQAPTAPSYPQPAVNPLTGQPM